MKCCPITYELFDGKERYSARGIQLLDKRLTTLNPLEHSASEQIQESINRAGKMSIQGVQPKLSARLNIKENKFDIVDIGGKYIFKPPSQGYPELPENESLTMKLAATLGIDTPLNGLLYAKDNSMTYFIKRFDRQGRTKISVEDFAQLTGASRDTKYDASMEEIISTIDRYTTFPQIERLELFKRTIFNFIVGNEDMHLKNFTLIKQGRRIKLSPAYDFLNTSIAIQNPKEELALPLKGKKKKLTRNDFLVYFAKDRLNLTDKSLAEELARFKQVIPTWRKFIENSFLSKKMKEKYSLIVSVRTERLF